MHRLCDGPRPNWPAKAAWLARALEAGLPVPAGCVHAMTWSEALREEIDAMLRDGPLIVRSALHGEDEGDRSAAGLGQSFAGLDTIDAVKDAVLLASQARTDPWLAKYRGLEAHPDDAVIVQRQAPRELLVVAALLPEGADYVEVHDGAGDVLDAGATPMFSGLLRGWSDPRSRALADLLTKVRDRLPAPSHGFDVECVLGADAVHLVQVRPLSRDLMANGRAFLEAVRAAGQGDRIRGRLQLDAEHNPAPLSPAHASLMEWLSEARPDSGGLTTLAGWLYVRTKVRDLGAKAKHLEGALAPRAALERLHFTEIPQARARLHALDERLGRLFQPDLHGHDIKGQDNTASLDDTMRAGLRAEKREALTAFSTMIGVYLKVLVPARAAAGKLTASNPDDPFSLRERLAFADVLPTVWDIAAPSLAELGTFEPSTQNTELPTSDADAAVLLTEWDDHLFALGLAPLRRVYLAFGQYLELGDDIFGLTLNQLDEALDGSARNPAAIARAQLERTAQWAALAPPLFIEDGTPVPVHPRRRLHGIGFGPDYEGTIAQRDSLESLLRDPPDPVSIVVLPSLTAQAALAISTLGLRAVCCEHGGAMSHAALIMRELELSGLVGCVGCTSIPNGTRARIDATRGRLQIASSVMFGS